LSLVNPGGGLVSKLASRWALVASALGCLAPSAVAAPPTVRGLAIDETLAGEAVTAEALNHATLRATDLPVFARIVLQTSDLAGDGEHRWDALDARFERYRLKGVPVLLSVAGPLPAPDAAEPWRQLVRALADRYHGRVKAYQLPALGPPRAAAREVAFVLRLGAVELRAADPDAFLAIGPVGAGDREWLEALYNEDAAPYVDAVAVAGGDSAAAVSAIEPVVAQFDPDSAIFATGLPLPADEAEGAKALLDWQVSHLGGRVSLSTFAAPSSRSLAAALNAAARVKDALSTELLTLDDKTAGLRLSEGGRDVTSSLRHFLLYDAGSLSTYLFYAAGGRSGDLRVELNDSTGLKPELRDPLSGKAGVKVRNEWDTAAHLARVTVPLLDHLVLLQLTYGGDNALVSRSEVTGSVLPSVAEIVFRHQQAQAQQDSRVKSYLADARMEMHFRPSATDPGFDVVTENQFFSDAQGSEWEETTFLLNGTRWGPKRPAFPMLQAEKVLSLPLDLRLSKDYRYKLLGLEKVEGRNAYAVRFDPIDESKSLYRGTIWIDAASYAKLKVQTLQTRLSAPVVSSEEIQFFAPVAEVDGLSVHLLTHFTTRQIMLVAGRNLLVERQVLFSKIAINPPDFEAKRTAARGSDHIMYRDTDAGLRNFVKRAGTRVVEDRPTKSAKALAFGTIIDPSYDYPLPIVGLNYLNFDFLGRDNQLALLFGGILALANVQRPKAFGDKVSASVDLFAIAVSSNDQVFDAAGERLEKRLRNRPFSTGLNLGWQADSFQKISGSYQFRFDDYGRDDGTAPDFKAPSSTVTNGFGLSYEYRRGGYTLQASGTYYRRGSWDPWGGVGDYEADQRSYEKYSGSFSKDFFFGAVHKVHLNAAYFGGRRLDRFSQYQFGLFEENKIHGVPSSGVRFGDLAMLRAAYSFNLLDIYGVDVFLDQALGRDPRVGPWRSVTGLGLGFNLRGPFGTLLRGEVGKSFLPSSLNGAGSFVAQVTVLKPL
jgi:MucB/RseB N-terminal domain